MRTETPEEFFESRNGGKSVDKATTDEEYITPLYAVALIKEYVDLLRQHHEAEMVEFAEWLGINQKPVVSNGKIICWKKSYQSMDNFTTSELLAQFRSNNGGQG